MKKHFSTYALPFISGALCTALVFFTYNCRKSKQKVRRGLQELIGDTPLVYLKSLSELTGCEIYGKCQFLNPGGSVKDRVALQIIEDAEKEGKLLPGKAVYEGTVGSTGISLSLVALKKGYRSCIVMPDDQSLEKKQQLRALGAEIIEKRPSSIVDEANNNVRVAEALAKQDKGSLFSNQFETLSNFKSHYKGTGPQIWRQLQGKIDAFVCGAGTGGTIAGVSAYLKQKSKKVKIFLVDPKGSSLLNRVRYGVLYATEEAETYRVKHPYDTIIEGVGLNRLTANFEKAQIDWAFHCSDQEAVHMSRFILHHQGLFLGSSSALNLVGAIKTALHLGPGKRIVTILCDSGTRHFSKFYSDDYLRKDGLEIPKQTPQDLSFVKREGTNQQSNQK